MLLFCISIKLGKTFHGLPKLHFENGIDKFLFHTLCTHHISSWLRLRPCSYVRQREEIFTSHLFKFWGLVLLNGQSAK